MAPESEPPKNRRQELRFEKSLRLTLFTPAGDVLDDLPVMQNISAGGMCFKSSAPVFPGKGFSFLIMVPGYGHIYGDAEAKWSSAQEPKRVFLVGASFKHVASSAQQGLCQYLQQGPR